MCVEREFEISGSSKKNLVIDGMVAIRCQLLDEVAAVFPSAQANVTRPLYRGLAESPPPLGKNREMLHCDDNAVPSYSHLGGGNSPNLSDTPAPSRRKPNVREGSKGELAVAFQCRRLRVNLLSHTHLCFWVYLSELCQRCRRLMMRLRGTPSLNISLRRVVAISRRANAMCGGCGRGFWTLRFRGMCWRLRLV